MTPDAQQPYFCPHCGVRSDRATIKSELVSIDIPHAWVCYNCGWKWIDVDIMQKNIRTHPHTPAPEQEIIWRCCEFLPRRPMDRKPEDCEMVKEAARTATLAENKRVLEKMVNVLAAHTIQSDDFTKDGIKAGWILVGGYEPIIDDIESLRAAGEQQ
jgi:hypothetical protein